MDSHADLLKKLRIDRNPGPPPSRRWLWITLAAVAAVVLLAGAAWAMLGRDGAVEV
ncbi:MAG: efflux RND transporter periplasmic adaptor subunit, partial [Gammaproteobacteria bacterium]|nr:efflux RND transporter periplasmic adaptor subunit [Gammaproteobacteria bacterium]